MNDGLNLEMLPLETLVGLLILLGLAIYAVFKYVKQRHTPATKKPLHQPREAPPKPSQSVPSAPRGALAAELSKMLPSMFEEILFLYNVPEGHLPRDIPQAEKVERLLDFARAKEKNDEIPELRQLVEQSVQRNYR